MAKVLDCAQWQKIANLGVKILLNIEKYVNKALLKMKNSFGKIIYQKLSSIEQNPINFSSWQDFVLYNM